MVAEVETVKDYGKQKGVGGINPFPAFGAVVQASICFIPDWLTSNHLLQYLCVCECVCFFQAGEKWNAETPTLKMLRT